MSRLTLAIAGLLMAACAHERAVTQQDAAARKGPVTTPASQPAHPAERASDDSVKSAVNADLLKQGYRTGMHNGQLVYCRTEQTTGTRFKSQVCLSEGQILDEQKRARDTLNSPRASQCVGSGCSS